MNKLWKKTQKGSITLEAVIVVPIFIFLMLLFYGMILSFLGRHMILQTAIQTTESLSLDSYAGEKLFTGEGLDGNKDGYGDDAMDLVLTKIEGGKINWFPLLLEKLKLDSYFNAGPSASYDKTFSSHRTWYRDDNKIESVCRERFLSFFAGGFNDDQVQKADKLLESMGIIDGVDGLDFSECKIEDDEIIFKVKYRQKFIYDFNGQLQFNSSATSISKMWGQYSR